MTKIQPIPTRRVAGEFLEMWHWSEQGVRDKIAALQDAELSMCRSTLISRMQPGLAIEMPRLDFAGAVEEWKPMEEGGQPGWQVELTLKIDDTYWITPFVVWPGADEVADYSPDPESGTLRVSVAYNAISRLEAQNLFATALAEFTLNIDKMGMEVERYNGALPYLITLYSETRLAGLPISISPEPEPAPSMAEIQEALDDLVRSGDAVEIPELESDTGKLRLRYYARKNVPKPS